MALPAPENYRTWQEYAQALIAALSADDPSVPSYNQLPATMPPPPPPPPVDPTPGDGYPPYPVEPIWLDPTNALLYLGNSAWNPPTAGDLFVIDTANILDAAIVTSKLAVGSVNRQRLADLAVDAAKLADSAVTSTKIANLAVGTAAIANLAVGSAQIADAAIITVKIGEAQIVEAKIADLAVNTAKIANAAISSAKIANLAVGSAHMQLASIQSAHIGDAQVNNAKIGDFIQSYNWNPTSKLGWKLDKNGVISGQSINIYDSSGNLVFGAGGQIDFSRITNINLQLFANAFGQLGLYDPEQGLIDAVVLRDAGVANMAYIDFLHSGNISSYIANAAIGNALIANAAIGSAQIIDASILTAKIADAQIIQSKIASLAVGEANIINGSISNAKLGFASIQTANIADLQITTAKIGSHQVTTRQAVRQSGYLEGVGSSQFLVSLSFDLANAGDVYFSATASQNYYGAGGTIQPFTAQLWVHWAGGSPYIVAQQSAGGVYTPGFAMSWMEVGLPPGHYACWVAWTGGSDATVGKIRVSNACLTVDGAFK